MATGTKQTEKLNDTYLLEFNMSNVGAVKIAFYKSGNRVTAFVHMNTNASTSTGMKTESGIIPAAYRPVFVDNFDLDSANICDATAFIARRDTGGSAGLQGLGQIIFRSNGDFIFSVLNGGASGVTMVGTISYFTN